MTERQAILKSVERVFRWMRETITLIKDHHRHPLPMVALIFMYAETLGKPLVPKKEGEKRYTKEKVTAFVKEYMPKLWDAFAWNKDREEILADHYRNGLVHEMFMKKHAGIHEDISGDTQYVSRAFPGVPYSINIDRLVPDFLEGINEYFRQLETDEDFFNTFNTELPKNN